MTPEEQANALYMEWAYRSGHTYDALITLIAAALAKKDAEIALYRESADGMKRSWNAACAEIERLKLEIKSMKAVPAEIECQMAIEERDELKQRVAELEAQIK